MRLPKDTQIAEETALAREAALQAALAAIDGNDSTYARALRIEYQAALDQDENATSATEKPGSEQHRELRVRAVAAARDAISNLRRKEDIGDDAFRRIEAALDRAELYAERYAMEG